MVQHFATVCTHIFAAELELSSHTMSNASRNPRRACRVPTRKMNCQQKIVGPAEAHASTAWLMQLYIGFRFRYFPPIATFQAAVFIPLLTTVIHVKRLGCCTSFGAVGSYGKRAIHGYKRCFKNEL
jgi:hypothetical protein